MKFSQVLKQDQRILDYYEKYLQHPFVKGFGEGTLSEERFRKYLIQDSLYLKDYAKVFASVFMLANSIEDLQFLHTCIGVVMSDETNMHTKYLHDYGLSVYKVDNEVVLPANRAYLDYMLGFIPSNDIKKIFVATLPCTLTYEHIGKELKKRYESNLENNYYKNWIETYAGREFEIFSIKSCELLDRICKDISEEEKEELIQIFLKASEHEMNFWDMCYNI